MIFYDAFADEVSKLAAEAPARPGFLRRTVLPVAAGAALTLGAQHPAVQQKAVQLWKSPTVQSLVQKVKPYVQKGQRAAQAAGQELSR